MEEPTDTVTFNGINGETGEYLNPPISLAAAAKLAKRDAHPAWELQRRAELAVQGIEEFGPPFGVDTERIDSAGWCAVFPTTLDRDSAERIEAELLPLLEHRQRVAGNLYRKLSWDPSVSVRKWLDDQGAQFGSPHPKRIPLNVLLVGGPEHIPWEHQFLLDLDYSVGRLAFDDPGDYGRYAKSVVAHEEGAGSGRRSIALFGTRHLGDRSTQLSASHLVEPLSEESDSVPTYEDQGFTRQVHLAKDATRTTLEQLFSADGPRPALLFTATHGVGFCAGHERQRDLQGSLLLQEWRGFGSIERAHYFAGEDVADDADVRGMVAFLFGCHTAGVPARARFPSAVTDPHSFAELAPSPFVARLPQALLAHPNGSALAVIGHVDRAWGFSIVPRGGRSPHLDAYRQGLAKILGGLHLGAATEDFSRRSAFLSTELGDSLKPSAEKKLSSADLVYPWIERNDAQGYVLLGDPAVRIKP